MPKKSNQQSQLKTAKPAKPAPALGRLTPTEAQSVLLSLLEKNPDLRPAAEELAQCVTIPPGNQEIAGEVFYALTSIGLEELNERAGAQSWGYVEPSEGAWELLGESLEDLMAEMKRQAELGHAAGAEAICAGMVEGLYRTRNENSDGALGWAPDFAIEQASHVVKEFFGLLSPGARLITSQPLLETLTARSPEWTDLLRRVLNQSVGE